jgi:hypothetical protein
VVVDDATRFVASHATPKAMEKANCNDRDTAGEGVALDIQPVLDFGLLRQSLCLFQHGVQMPAQ